jgi:hypothetical protein
MSRKSKLEYLRKIRSRYKAAGKKEKSKILDEFCEVCGYSRKYAIRLLNRKCYRTRKKPGPKPTYGKEVVRALIYFWKETDQMCSKRLKAALPLWMPYYEERYPLKPEIRKKLLKLSPATMDRLLIPTRRKFRGKGISGTKPGSIIKTQIPIQTSNWDISKPGFLEADTVAHCGGSLSGNFVWSLTLTDICTGWTENRAVWNKGARGVLEKISDIENALPFPILGFDCDNGSEFLNHHLIRYFLTDRENSVQFTRSRPNHRNDNAHVEQKNWSHVRELFGYERFDREELVPAMNDMYSKELSQLRNFFYPSLKLKRKVRINSRIKRYYGAPETPFQRVMKSPHVSEEEKHQLQRTFDQLKPFVLKRRIDRKLKKIATLLRKTAGCL